uniref:ENT domain-containing protein n=1 Tax=Stomoxys calcitrans TaxID=35570 RepID=A0A1I8PLB1_STOCA
MWPQALQMTRDECRGILRRLELESYSQVISVFRAQGGLSDAKAKLLEELRGIFHISNERHRAEARRVANDEQLATIAEAISGPNTWQEWSREGRRPYPMLPRVAPHTALALIANNIAEDATNENAKLPYPAETGDAVKEENNAERERTIDSLDRNNYVVTSDPFKVPKIPAGTKKNLKRNINDQNQGGGTGSGKKRATSENSPQKNHQNSNRQHYPHITANSPQMNSASTASSGSEQKKQLQQQVAAQQQNNQHLQKQRYFHHQQQLTKQKMAKKAAAAASAHNNATSSASHKRQATPAKSGRRANQKLLMEQQQMTLKQMQIAEQQVQTQSVAHGGSGLHIDLTSQPVTNLTQQQNDLQFLAYSTQNVPPQQILMDEQSAHGGQLHVLASATNQQQQSLPTSLITPLTPTSASASTISPQIAASKRDISKNLNKLQQLQQNQHQSTHPGTPSFIPSPDMHTSIGSIISSSSPVVKSTEKSLISTTPVQKYIVEERQPSVNTTPGSIVSLQNHPLSSGNANTSATHVIQVSNASGQQPQIMSLPQYSAAASKLRAVNTTLIAPGAKISPTTNKKITTITSPLSPINAGALHELANVASTQSQVLHIVETSQGNNNPTNSATFTSSLHTPPAVIQIQNNSQGASHGNVSTSDMSSSASSTQSKVLTATILPLVLPGSGNNNQNSVGSSNINNAPIVIGSTSSTTGSVGITSMATSLSSTTTSGSASIIKSFPSTMVLNTNTTTLPPVTVTGTILSTLGAGGTMFRKPQNIIKNSLASVTTASKSTTVVSAAAHVLSNVKLTSKSITTSTAGTSLCSTNTTFKNILPSSTLVRTNIKICPSPNGKVLIQPADGQKIKLNTSTLPHKLISTANPTSATATAVGGVGGGQRIAIQKVQIIPAPMGSPVGASNIQSAGNTINAKTPTLAGKSNVVFMSSSAASNVRPVTLSKTGNNILLKSTANTQLQSNSSDSASKANIVVLGQSISGQNTPLKMALNQKLELSNSFINEDAPLDILNMPIVMDTGVGVCPSETVTVLPGNIIESNNCNTNTSATPIIVEQNPQTSSTTPQTVILGATDWEMELDQAITTAANNSSTMQYQKSTTHRPKRTISTSSSSSSLSMSSSTPTNSSSKQKRLNSDLVSIELKTSRPTSTQQANASNIIVVDSFDDVIVEEHEDDMSSSNIEQISISSDAVGGHSEGQPKILDMQIYQQHDGIDGNKSQIAIVGSQQSQQLLEDTEDTQQQTQSTMVEPQRQERQRPQQAECEDDAGFDETIVSEIDENTAIEYIEEDGVVVASTITSNLTTTTTSTTVAIADRESASESTILTKALTGGVKIASNTSSNSNHLEAENTATKPTAPMRSRSRSMEDDTTDQSSMSASHNQNQHQHETKANNSGT